jgi:hypothetical protein
MGRQDPAAIPLRNGKLGTLEILGRFTGYYMLWFGTVTPLYVVVEQAVAGVFFAL